MNIEEKEKIMENDSLWKDYKNPEFKAYALHPITGEKVLVNWEEYLALRKEDHETT